MMTGCLSQPSKYTSEESFNYFTLSHLMLIAYCLFVASRGLSFERVIASFLKIHCVTSDPSSISLVLVINTTDQEEVGPIPFS